MYRITVASPGQVQVDEGLDLPQPGEGEALVKLLYGGICGTDLGTYRGTMAYTKYPCLPGHEFAVEVVSLPGDVAGLQVGMLATAVPYFNCGECYSCRRGLVNCCTSNKTMGVQREGAFSEFTAIPARRLVPATGLDPAEVAVVEPFCISWHGVARADVQPGERVLVVGAGTIGVFAGLAAKAKGARVYVSDVSAEKLRMAERFGFDGYLRNDSPEAMAEQVAQATGGDGFDVTVEAVGLAATFLACIQAVAFGGRVVVIGVSKQNADFFFTDIQRKELAIFGSRNALRRDFEQVIAAVRGGGLDLKQVVTDTYPARQAPQAFADFSADQGGKLKVLLDFTA
ncbi:MAG: zinc-binding dehydrogenase [Propionibacteriaceae bacterium]|jgi:2-desacetyl-2-hydroxyethyl bacteriochlorophyllide A dehydrogenase|nr:zinc-binding dehydrogenase [Propionibacteriaceae bacterium]